MQNAGRRKIFALHSAFFFALPSAWLAGIGWLFQQLLTVSTAIVWLPSKAGVFI
jgi:hypothetical protein